MVIPTHNRPQLLHRCLSHLARDKNPFPILVADGSDSQAAEVNADIVRGCASTLDVHYLSFSPRLPFIERLRDVTEQVGTPFVQIHADDDFLFAVGLVAAVETLVTDHRTAAAQGAMMAVRVAGSSLVIKPYVYVAVGEAGAADRLKRHFHFYTPTFYSTFRTAALLRALTLATAFQHLPHRFQEIALSALSVLQGKTCFTPALHGLRTTHPDAGSVTDAAWPAIVQSEGFNSAIGLFTEVIGTELALHEGCSREVACNVAKAALLDYLDTTPSRKKRQSTEFAAQSQLVRNFFTGEDEGSRELLNAALRTLV